MERHDAEFPVRGIKADHPVPGEAHVEVEVSVGVQGELVVRHLHQWYVHVTVQGLDPSSTELEGWEFEREGWQSDLHRKCMRK
jgi:hypothetical protein